MQKLIFELRTRFRWDYKGFTFKQSVSDEIAFNVRTLIALWTAKANEFEQTDSLIFNRLPLIFVNLMWTVWT